VQVAQNAADTLKSCHGDYEAASERFGGHWDGQVWEQDLEDGVLQVTPTDCDTPLMGTAEVAVYDENGERLFCLSAAWQEVESNG
jgi:hypothetical protein